MSTITPPSPIEIKAQNIILGKDKEYQWKDAMIKKAFSQEPPVPGKTLTMVGGENIETRNLAKIIMSLLERKATLGHQPTTDTYIMEASDESLAEIRKEMQQGVGGPG